MRRLTLIPLALRTVGLGAVLVLLINPSRSRPVAGGAPPLVLLDASLSMAGTKASWPEALDSARRLGAGGSIWRFGSDVDAFDSTPPHDGQSLLAPALAAAAARGGPVIVITDGAIADSADLPPDLLRRPRVIMLPRPPFFDAYLASVEGPRRVALGDTVRLRVAYGVAGRTPPGAARQSAITVATAGRRITSTPVTLPDSGSLATEVVIPPAQLATGFQALDVRLAAAGDSEPRDDARLFVIEVSAQPAAVVLAAPPDWESRFFAKTLADVSRVPVKLFVQTEATKWRDGTTLAPLGAAAARAASGARLVALIGDPSRLAPYRRHGAVVLWPFTAARSGDWYVDPPPASPLAEAFAGVDWDSLPPAQGVVELPLDSNTIVILTARLGRRGVSRPLALVRDSAGVRSATIAGAGLWRWGFRGGAPAEAYRSLVAAIADWLLSDAAAGKERFGPVTAEVPQGLPLVWRWRGGDAPNSISIALESPAGTRTATLRFDAQGEASLRLAPGVYRWRAGDPGGVEQGMVAVEQYSDEWRPARAVLRAQPGEWGGVRHDVGARDLWWLYATAIAAFAAEWTWRRRQGLP